MIRKLTFAATAFLILISVSACGKKADEQQEQKVTGWDISSFTEGKSIPPKPIPLPGNLVVEVPDSVKSKYSTVTMGIGDRKTLEVRKFTVKIGETVKVPGTDYSIKVSAYLPSWVVRGNVATSKGDMPDDPAVRATIYEKDKQVFDGFIFQRHTTPSFLTDKHAIGLLGAS
jgi:hypothetical protein